VLAFLLPENGTGHIIKRDKKRMFLGKWGKQMFRDGFAFWLSAAC
jgi:hypothetical protein